jgi:hypothetical protein
MYFTCSMKRSSGVKIEVCTSFIKMLICLSLERKTMFQISTKRIIFSILLNFFFFMFFTNDLHVYEDHTHKQKKLLKLWVNVTDVFLQVVLFAREKMFIWAPFFTYHFPYYLCMTRTWAFQPRGVTSPQFSDILLNSLYHL